jgi:hypothetical protein
LGAGRDLEPGIEGVGEGEERCEVWRATAALQPSDDRFGSGHLFGKLLLGQARPQPGRNHRDPKLDLRSKRRTSRFELRIARFTLGHVLAMSDHLTLSFANSLSRRRAVSISPGGVLLVCLLIGIARMAGWP